MTTTPCGAPTRTGTVCARLTRQMVTCACGGEIHVQKTGECQRYYNRRYAREHPRPKPEPRPRVLLTDDEKRSREAERRRRWRAANPDKVREQKRRYYERHPDKVWNRRPEKPEPKEPTREDRGLPNW